MCSAGADLLQALRNKGFDNYGTVIPGEFVRSVLGIDLPAVASRSEFAVIELAILGPVSYCRGALLREGKYLKGERDDYRILTPGENAGQAASMLDSASRKLTRRRVLLSSMPGAANREVDTSDSRAASLEQAVKREKSRNNLRSKR